MTRGWLCFGALIVVGLLGAAHLMRPQPPRRAATTTQAAPPGAPVVLGGSTRRERRRRRPVGAHPSDDRPVAVRPAPEAAREAAARFLHAFVAYEVGRAGFGDLRTLRRTVTPSLWSELNSGRGEPAAPSTIPAARLTRLVPGVAARRSAVTLLATLQRGRERAGLALVLRRVGDEWRVAGIGR